MSDVEFTDRYQALGVPLPDPATMCRGGCQGLGIYPVKRAEWRTDHERQAWEEQEARAPNQPGDEWHFVRCGTCGGTGVDPDRRDVP